MSKKSLYIALIVVLKWVIGLSTLCLLIERLWASVFFLSYRSCFISILWNMRITNWQLVEIMLADNVDPNILVRNLEVGVKLIKKYGKALFADMHIAAVKEVAKDVYMLLIVLRHAKKTDISSVKAVISLVKQRSDRYTWEYKVNSDSQVHNDTLKEFVQNSFAWAHVEHHVVEKQKVSVTGEWRYYKRDLEQDLKKLLYV